MVHVKKGPEDKQNARETSREELKVAHHIASEGFAGRWENISKDLHGRSSEEGPSSKSVHHAV